MLMTKKWEWQPNIYDLKTVRDSITTVWNSSPYVMICSQDEKASQPDFMITLDMSKSFLFSPDIGWHWHKSWKLPALKLTLEIVDPITQEHTEVPENLVFSVYAAVLQKSESMRATFQQLKLAGNSVVRVKEGSALIEGLKFEDTSFNLNGERIHLMWFVGFEDEITQNSAPKILYSKISPPIFVDSRSGAIDSLTPKQPPITQELKDERSGASCHWSQKELFQKCYVKRKPQNQAAKKSKLVNSEMAEITPNLDGLMLYLTSDEISKPRDFLFYLLRFSEVFGVFIPSSHHELVRSGVDGFLNYLNDSHTIKVLIRIPDLLLSLQSARTVFIELKRLWTNEKLELLLDPDSIPAGYCAVQLGNHEDPSSMFSLLRSAVRTRFEGSSYPDRIQNPAVAHTKSESIPEAGPKPSVSCAADKCPKFTYRVNSCEIEKEFGLTTLDLLKIPVINIQKAKESHQPGSRFTEDDLERIPASKPWLEYRS
jgi:hypothetical protein